MKPQMVLALIFPLQGALLMLVSLPLIRGRVPRNPLYGFRTPKTLLSDDIWYPANRYAGRALFWAGAAIIAGSLALLSLASRMPANKVGYAAMAITFLPLGIALYRSFRYLRRL